MFRNWNISLIVALNDFDVVRIFLPFFTFVVHLQMSHIKSQLDFVIVHVFDSLSGDFKVLDPL